ncbi:MAG: MFS transporter, partial [Syntrophales bacterium LBB04]|nr:MFS transporter [Syntrophales bacterium LBB04]
ASPSLIPSRLLGPLAGVLVDRWDPRRILIVTQAGLMLQVLVLAYLAHSQQIAVWHILALSVIQGIINAFDIPARQTFVIEMVDKKEDLGNAIALNSSMFNGARMIGPAIAGFLIALGGEAMCFFVDGLSYLAVIASLLGMSLKAPVFTRAPGRIWDELKEGFRYVRTSVPIRSILIMVAWGSLMGMSYLVLFPVVAKDILHGGPHTLGFLTSAAGLGALSGGLFLASRKNALDFGKYIVLGACIGGIGLIFFAFSTTPAPASFFVLVASFGLMVQMASCNTMLQTLVENEKRGRIMSFYAMAFMGMAPFGSLLAGALANFAGVSVAIRVCGFFCLLSSLLFASKLPALRQAIRPVYVQGGIGTEAVSGVEVATQLSTPRD